MSSKTPSGLSYIAYQYRNLKKNNPYLKGYLLLLLSAICSSLFVLCFRELSKEEESINAIFLMYIFATAFSAPWFLVQKSWSKKLSRKTWFFIGMVALFSIIGNYLSTIAVRNIIPSVSQIIQRTDIFFGIMYGIFIFKERLSSSILISIALCSVGLLLIFLEFWDIGSISYFWGTAAAMASAFCFSTMQYFTKIIINKTDSTVINFWRLIISLLFTFLLTEKFKLTDFSLNSLLFSALSAFFGPVLARTLINYSTRYVPFSTIAICNSAAPIITFFLQYAILGIVLTKFEIFGSLFILGSVLMVMRYKG